MKSFVLILALPLQKQEDKSDAVSMILIDELERYRKLLPLLKFVRGEGWQDSHWAQLFTMLGIPVRGENAVTIENLRLHHFLDKADVMVEKADEIKQLQAQVKRLRLNLALMRKRRDL